VFGTSELAIATVLAAYMGGLALGARIVEKLLPRIQRPVRLYIWLELAIALAALCWVPLVLWLGDLVLVAGFGGQSQPPSSDQAPVALFYLVTAFIALIIPTALMGATLPVLVRYAVHSNEQVGKRTGQLYAFNTAGAVIGALSASLLILPALGLAKTIWVAIAVNLLVAGLAYVLAGKLRSQPAQASAVAETPVRFSPRLGLCVWWVLPIMLLSGAVSFVHEVLWTRMLQHVVGSSVFAFGIMVSSFLLGIALGGAAGSWVAKTRHRAVSGLALAQVGVALGAVCAWYLLLHFAQSIASLGVKIGMGLAVLLPLTFFVGMTYPLAVRVLASEAGEASAASARVYAWNTVGAIAGALAGGFILIPWLRYEGVIEVLVLTSLVLAVLVSLVLVPMRKALVGSLAGLAVIAVLAFQPGVPLSLLKASPLKKTDGSMEYYAVGKTADVTLFRSGNLFELRTNGLPESGTMIKGGVPVMDMESWMSPLAVLARPQAESMLVVGLGGGNAVAAIPPTIKTVDVIELEQDVVRANQAMADRRITDPLQDERIHLIVNDARGSLTLTDKRYDIVVSQPSHPWTAGASHLYTREFMHQVKDHLNPDGVFVQWMGTDFINEDLMKSLTATLLTEFKQIRVFLPYPTTLLFMASDGDIAIEEHLPELSATLNSSLSHYSKIGLNVAEDVLAVLALDTRSARIFSQGSPLITDNNNRLATSHVFDLRQALNPQQVGAMLAPYDPINSELLRNRIQSQGYSMEYLWRRIGLWSYLNPSLDERLTRIAKYYLQTDLGLYFGFQLTTRQKGKEEGNELLARGLEVWPESQLLNYAFAEQQMASMLDPGPLLEKLQGEPLLVYRAIAYSLLNQWGPVAELDNDLASIAWTAPWAKMASQIRAEWRARVENPELQRRFGLEGMALIDRGLIISTDLSWFYLRALLAKKAERPDAVVESVAGFLSNFGRNESDLTESLRQETQARLMQLVQLMENLDTNQLDQDRFREVKIELNEQLAEQ